MGNIKNITNKTIIPLEIVEKLRAEKLVKTSLDKSDNPTVKDQIKSLLLKMKFDDHVPLYVSTIGGELVYVNDGYQALVSESEERSSRLEDDQKLPPSLISILNEVQLTRGSVTVEEQLFIQGYMRQYRSRHFPICDDDGYVIAVGGTYTDCTGQHKNTNDDEENSVAEQRYRDFARATSDWYWEVDKSGKLTYVSDRFTALTGTPAFLMVGRKLDDIGNLLDDFNGEEIQSSDFLVKTSPFRDQLLVLKDQHDENIYIFLSGVPRFDIDTGDFEGFRGAGTDVTESYNAKSKTAAVQKTLEETLYDLKDKREKLNEATAQAEAALDAKSDFLAAMSHELRTPLNAIIGFAEAMTLQAFGSLNDQYISYSNDIMNAGRHLLGLINDILDVAVLESGKIQLELMNVSLNEVIEKALNLVVLSANDKNIDVTEIAVPINWDVYVDERRVTQIFVNLMGNAVKFTPEGGKIGIKVNQVSNDMVGITVWDTGIGISEDQQELVFEKFHQDRGHIYSRKEEGTGLGLHISKHLAKQMGGDILLQSKVGKGSEFTVLLPLYKKI